jgi:hypothetical protein
VREHPRKSAAASEELNAQAETAMQTVRRLDAMVGGARSAVARTAFGSARRVSAPATRGKVVMMPHRGSARTDTDAPTAAFGT